MSRIMQRVGSIILACSIIFALATMAASASAKSLPDETSARSLTIYKYTADTLSDEKGQNTPSFTEVDSSQHHPLENIVFDIYKYADLDDEAPNSITVEDAFAWASEHEAQLVTSVVTDSEGKAKWYATESGSSADGIYLVVERNNRAVQITGKCNPFLVSLPYTNVDGDGWIYDVVVQPKNVLLPGPKVEKTVLTLDTKHGSVNIGTTFSWMIQCEIPTDLYYKDIVNDKEVEVFGKEYKITDTFDPRLDYMGNIVVKVIENEKDVVVLTDKEDYTVIENAEIGKPGGDISISLTNNGMKKIMENIADCSDSKLIAAVDTRLNNTVKAGERVDNDAVLEYTSSTGFRYTPISVADGNGDSFDPDNPTDPGDPSINENPSSSDSLPEVHTGGFKIVKVEKGNESTTIRGAEFKIATSEANAKANVFLKNNDGKDIVLTTDSNGQAAYLGLAYDEASKEPEGGTYYWLVETKVPSEYKLDKTPMRFTVNADTYGSKVEPYKITNERVGETKLPLTGAEAGGALVTIALVLIAIGAGVAAMTVIRNRRKNT